MSTHSTEAADRSAASARPPARALAARIARRRTPTSRHAQEPAPPDDQGAVREAPPRGDTDSDSESEVRPGFLATV
jgi:hypothetical protein